MAFRFRKRIKIAPGVYVNIGKKGISTSVGIKGATVNFGKNGTRGTVGLPGTGMSYSKKIFSSTSQSQQAMNTNSFEPAKEDESFDNFVETVQGESILMFCSYLKVNGVDIDNVDTSANTSDLVPDKEKDKELEKLMNKLASTIEEIKFSGASGQREKNRISKDLFAIKNWLSENFPDWSTEKDLLLEAKNNKLKEEMLEQQIKHEKLEKEKERKEAFQGMIIFAVIATIIYFVFFR